MDNAILWNHKHQETLRFVFVHILVQGLTLILLLSVVYHTTYHLFIRLKNVSRVRSDERRYYSIFSFRLMYILW